MPGLTTTTTTGMPTTTTRVTTTAPQSKASACCPDSKTYECSYSGSNCNACYCTIPPGGVHGIHDYPNGGGAFCRNDLQHGGGCCAGRDDPSMCPPKNQATTAKITTSKLTATKAATTATTAAAAAAATTKATTAKITTAKITTAKAAAAAAPVKAKAKTAKLTTTKAAATNAAANTTKGNKPKIATTKAATAAVTTTATTTTTAAAATSTGAIIVTLVVLLCCGVCGVGGFLFVRQRQSDLTTEERADSGASPAAVLRMQSVERTNPLARLGGNDDDGTYSGYAATNATSAGGAAAGVGHYDAAVPPANVVVNGAFEGAGERPAATSSALFGKHDNAETPGAPEYLRLGITAEGITHVLELIGFPYQWADSVKTASARVVEEKPHPDNLRQPNISGGYTYTRPADLQWVTDDHGDFVAAEVVTGSDGRGGVSFKATTSCSTCYDVVEAVRQYLKRTGNEDKSMLEVLHAENSQFVGPADVFVSHVQSSHVASMLGTINQAPNLWPDICNVNGQTRYWVDIMSLRQCQPSAFKPAEIFDVISLTKACLVEIDRTSSYLKRTFCIFEVFAAVQEDVPLLCAPKVVMEELRESERWDALLVLAREVGTLDCSAATSRSKKHTDQINEYIKEDCGFEALNEAVKCAILLGMDRTRPGATGITLVDGSHFEDTGMMKRRRDAATEWTEIIKQLATPDRPATRRSQLLAPLMSVADEAYSKLQGYSELKKHEPLAQHPAPGSDTDVPAPRAPEMNVYDAVPKDGTWTANAQDSFGFDAGLSTANAIANGSFEANAHPHENPDGFERYDQFDGFEAQQAVV